MKRPFNTAIVLSYGALGDFVMLLWLLVCVHKGRPEVRTVVLATHNAPVLKEMAAAYPFVEVVPARPLSLGKLFWSTGLRRNLFVIPPTFLDVPLFARAIVRLFALRGWRAGFVGAAAHPPYDVVLPFDTHKLFYENLAALLETLGLPYQGPPRLSFVEDTAVLARLGEGYIALAPFASNPGKTLPPERWEKLLQFMAEQFSNRTVAIVGSPSDKALAERYTCVHRSAVNYCGTHFSQTAAIIAHAACFVGADSGLTHVASVLEAPSVIVDNNRAVTWLPSHNPRAIILTEPKNCVCGGDKTGDCNYVIDGVSYLRCMYDVSDERIQEAVVKTLTA